MVSLPLHRCPALEENDLPSGSLAGVALLMNQRLRHKVRESRQLREPQVCS